MSPAGQPETIEEVNQALAALDRNAGICVGQLSTGHSVLWDALVSCLLAKEAIDPEQLICHISIAHQNTPAEQKGKFSRAIAQSAVKALLSVTDCPTVDKAPAWVKKIVADLEPEVQTKAEGLQ